MAVLGTRLEVILAKDLDMLVAFSFFSFSGFRHTGGVVVDLCVLVVMGQVLWVILVVRCEVHGWSCGAVGAEACLHGVADTEIA